jgi:GNAT superfamily N-acetyltransferase
MTDAAVVVRAPDRHDRGAWEALWSGYQAFYQAEITDATTDETWRRLHDPAEPVWAALAWRDGRAVGLVQWVFHRSTWSTGDFCYLNDLFVAPDLRGGGVGRRLIEHVHAEAKRAGCGRLYWLTHATNTQAMKLYDAVAANSGFVQYRMPL